MAEVKWNSVGNRRFEAGLDRGVLYIPDDGIVVPWNGLTSIDEPTDTVVEPLYFNGVKYYDYVSRGDFKATLRAYTYPSEFELFDGVFESPANGIYITGQVPTSTFHLSYRTMIGNDIDGVGKGYKIHVLYNLTAKPSNKVYETMGGRAESAREFAWDLTSVPVDAFNLRPTSHIIFDTTKMHEIAIYEIERMLYGTESSEPKILTVDEFEEMTAVAAEIQIFDNNNGTWTAKGSDYFIKVNETYGSFVIEEADAEYIDEETYNITSSTVAPSAPASGTVET